MSLKQSFSNIVLVRQGARKCWKALDSESRQAWLAKNRTLKTYKSCLVSLLSSPVRQLRRWICSFRLHPSPFTHFPLTPKIILIWLPPSPLHWSWSCYSPQCTFQFMLYLDLGSIWKLTALSWKCSGPLVFLTPHFVVISLFSDHSFHLSPVCFCSSTWSFMVVVPWDFCSGAGKNSRSDRVRRSCYDAYQQTFLIFCIL